jgi:hypothetical protein
LCETINKFNTLEKDVLLMKESIEKSHLLETNMDSIKQHRGWLVGWRERERKSINNFYF